MQEVFDNFEMTTVFLAFRNQLFTTYKMLGKQQKGGSKVKNFKMIFMSRTVFCKITNMNLKNENC